MKGYTGKILFVDLSNKQIETINFPEEVYKKYLSGIGLATYVLTKYIPQGADPLGKDNVLGLVSGLLTGSGTFMTGRWLATCKSPLTGGWGDASCGGTFAPAIKQCGFDGIFFRGISEKPVYLYADNKSAQLRDASAYWGLDACEAEERLIRDCTTRKRPQVALIGTAGERLSLISGITNDFGRIAARSGVGAVMGSKRLKAVVLAGSKPISGENFDAIRKANIIFADKVRKQNIPKFLAHMMPFMGTLMTKMKSVAPMDGMMVSGMLKTFGTAFNNIVAIRNGDAPIQNWQGTPKNFTKKKFKGFSPLVINKNEYKKYHCYSCPVGCGGLCDIKKESKGRFSHTHKPEYETANAFGALLLNADQGAVLYINEILNRAGMDSISAGGSVAYAIECYERGILTAADTGGLELKWGNTDAIVKLVEMMIAREGIGDLLADGVKIAARKIGKDSGEYAIHCGGQEPGMHDARLDPALGVHFSADPTPGKHTIGAGIYYRTIHLWKFCSWAPVLEKSPKAEEYIPSDTEALKSVAMSCFKMVLDGAGGCYYAMLIGNSHWNLAELLNYTTGWNLSFDNYMEIGKRIHTARQMFNVREGVNPKDNIMGKRMAGEPSLGYGPLKGITLQIDEMVKLHWKHFGWDENTGVPLPETLESLDLRKDMEAPS
jgi:aldehyde:ferredoxin oxidoreductase